MVRNLAIIPARSGSKRVKDKNIRPFAGRPLMAWAIDAALASGVFDTVYVSTDSIFKPVAAERRHIDHRDARVILFDLVKRSFQIGAEAGG